MREPSDARRQRIAAAVRSRGEVRLSELAAELAVSMVTVRRDVEELARAGALRRGHGVARSLGQVQPVRRDAGTAGPGAAADGGRVAVVVPERHAYLHEVMHGARSVLEEAGAGVALHITPRPADAERRTVERALADGARGLLVAPHWRTAAEEADCAWLARVGVPTVLMERRPHRGSPLYAVDSVCCDHWYGMHLAVDHLVSLGHRRIVLAAREDSPTARTLRAAFAEIAAAHPEVADWTTVLSAPDAAATDVGRDAGASRSAMASAGTAEPPIALAELLRERGGTAAVLHGDVDALLLVQRLADSGIRVPQDCSVVAYDDVVAALGSTPLTAVAPPKAEVGRVAAGLLLDRVAADGDRGPAPPRRVELLPELTVRGSSQPPLVV